MPPPLDSPAPEAEDLLDGDWFGEGSVFDTGEDLANALMVLASAQAAGTARALALSPGPLATPEPAVGLDGVRTRPPQRAPAPLAAPDEFQVATMPSSRGGPPTGWGRRAAVSISRPRRLGGRATPERSGWSIRQSVQMLRMTEDTLYRLREEAAQLTWQLAVLAHREMDA